MSRRLPFEPPREPSFQGKRPLSSRVPADFLQIIQPDEAELHHPPLRDNLAHLELHEAERLDGGHRHVLNRPPSSSSSSLDNYYNNNIIINTNRTSIPNHQLQQENFPVTHTDRYAPESSRISALNHSAPTYLSAPTAEEVQRGRLATRVMDNSQTYSGNFRNSNQDNPRSTSGYAFETHSDPSLVSLTRLAAGAMTPGDLTPQSRSTNSQSPHSLSREPYIEIPYRYSKNIDPSLCDFDPRSIEDDGDDGLGYKQHNHRSSVLSFGHSERNSLHTPPSSSNTKRGLFGTLGGLAIGKMSVSSSKTPPEKGVTPAENISNGTIGTVSTLKDSEPSEGEKSEWLSKQSSGRSKLRLLVLLIVTLVVLGGVTGGIVNVILRKKSSSNSGKGSAAEDQQNNGDLDKNSGEIKKLLNNPKLHKVFPAIDYTPSRSQYPDCLHDPPSQNDVTRDLAVLSQLSNTIRLYGTDCNQTEMLIHSIGRLDLKGKAKIWMGVWLNKNETTNSRQIAQMYHILDKYGADPFVGIIVGNEVLYRQDMTPTELGEKLSSIKTNLTSKGISLPVASSDLGDDWTAQLASKTDILMANIHPFFAGVSADAAASWTWNFWQQHNVVLQPDLSKNIISETGWPSAGGTSCGGADTCITGSVASIDAMNTFMNDWVCRALANGTNYFWFEAFDEPWKASLNEPGKAWEDKWGLLDAQRNLKQGVVIPSCGGKTVN